MTIIRIKQLSKERRTCTERNLVYSAASPKWKKILEVLRCPSSNQSFYHLIIHSPGTLSNKLLLTYFLIVIVDLVIQKLFFLFCIPITSTPNASLASSLPYSGHHDGPKSSDVSSNASKLETFCLNLGKS